MTKPMVFNYTDHERALEEIKKLKEDIANLQIRCRIAESEKPDRDCSHCKHRKADGCSRWDCEYEPKDMVEVVRCKDCKHRHEDECPKQFEEQYDIDEGDGYYDTGYIVHDYTKDDGYCDWGERREP